MPRRDPPPQASARPSGPLRRPEAAVTLDVMGHLAAFLLLALAAVSPSALDAILRAQALQDGRPYTARLTITGRASGRTVGSTIVAVPPDRLHIVDEGAVTTEHLRVGRRAWIRFGHGPWEAHPLPDLVGSLLPRRADDWARELTAA